MEALSIKLSNLEKLRRYLEKTIPDIYDNVISSRVMQSSIYNRYIGLCYRILKDSVIAENGFLEYGRIQSDPSKRISLPEPSDFIKITHDTLERISSGLDEEALIFFSSFYSKLHRNSNMSFSTELFAYSMLFWILRGKGKVVSPYKAKRIAFMFVLSPNILPSIYRWLHARKLSSLSNAAIQNPRLNMLITLIAKDIDELKETNKEISSSLLVFLESKGVIARIDGTDKYMIAVGRGSLTDLFNAFYAYSYEIAEKKIMFPRKEILFDFIVKNDKLEHFSSATVNKMYSIYQEINWLFYNLPAPEKAI